MCWCWPFGTPTPKKRKSSSSTDQKRRERQAQHAQLHGTGVPVVAEVQEKRRSRDSTQKKRSKEKVTNARQSREEKGQYQHQYQYQYQYSPRYDYDYRSRVAYRPALNLDVPSMWYRSVEAESSNSSSEMLLNPRPQRSSGQHRQRHPKRTSTSTLRGRGAKRDPPKHSKSKKSLKQDTRQGWSWLSSPPKTPPRRTHQRQSYDTSPRSHRSPRQHHYQQIPEASQAQPSSSQHRHRSRQQPQTYSSRQVRSRTPNTAARRTPDRRFAVLAATNQALEDLRREAFSQPSPPPRRERLQRYQGVSIPTSSIPFNWDCVSSSQASGTAQAGLSSRHRRSRR